MNRDQTLALLLCYSWFYGKHTTLQEVYEDLSVCLLSVFERESRRLSTFKAQLYNAMQWNKVPWSTFKAQQYNAMRWNKVPLKHNNAMQWRHNNTMQ